MNSINLITVTGSTASGKTSFAAHLAQLLNGEIISADSRQVYREMNLGTGKDYQDYIIDGHKIAHHLIDIRDPGYKYNVFEFQQDFLTAFNAIKSSNKMPLLVGGTGMYIEAVSKGYKLINVPVDEELREELEKMDISDLIEILKDLKPEQHNTTDQKHKKRIIRAIEIAKYYQSHDEIDTDYPAINQLVFGIKYDRHSRRGRITERLKARIDAGLIEEVEQLLKKISPEDLIFYGLEYKYITLFINGKLSKEEMVKKLEIAIHQFAKRQMTWFRKMEKQGTKIYWIDGNKSLNEKIDDAKYILKRFSMMRI